jgi:shikimate dehydrogenase
MITARTRLFVLLGDPVAHSLSPRLHNAANQAAGVDGIYVALRCLRDDLPGFLRGLSRGGGGGNVTLPHKEKAATVLDRPLHAVRRTGACNTFWFEDGKVVGDNTDVEGFRRSLRDFLGRSPEGARVLLVGAGGAARAALVALLDDGVGEVSVTNRTMERARNMVRRIGGARTRLLATRTAWQGQSYDLVVNATSVGLRFGDPSPLALDRLGSIGGVVDMVYREGTTTFVESAQSLGIPAMDGRPMLAHQAAAAFERWWDQPAPLEVMQGALTEPVAGRG